MELRYGDRPHCHECEREYHLIAMRRACAWRFCAARVYLCVGTPFEKSRAPLREQKAVRVVIEQGDPAIVGSEDVPTLFRRKEAGRHR